MKRTQFKEALKNVQKQIVSFISIVIVLALGTGILLVCLMGERSTKIKGNGFYDSAHYRDIEVLSTRGITEDDVEEVKKLQGVTDAEGILSGDMIASIGQEKTAVKVVSRTERLDQPTLLDGQLPTQAGECAVTVEFSEQLGAAIGDRITLRGANQDLKLLRLADFTVTGIIRHPNKIRNKEVSAPTLIVTKESFDTETLGIPYTGILLTVQTTGDTFSDEYTEQIREYVHQLSLFGQQRAALRDAQLIADARARLDEGEKTLADAKIQLDDAAKKAADGEAEIADGQRLLLEGQATLNASKLQLTALKAELDSGKAKLEKAKPELEKAKKELTSGRAQLDEAKKALAEAEKTIAENEKKLKDAEKELKNAETQLNEAKIKLSLIQSVIDEAENTLDTGKDLVRTVLTDLWPAMEQTIRGKLEPIRAFSERYALTAADLIRKLAERNGFTADKIAQTLQRLEESAAWLQLENIYTTLSEGFERYESGLEEYNAGWEKWNDGRQAYEEGAAQLEEGKKEYQKQYVLYMTKESEYNIASLLYETNLASYNDGVAEYENGLKQYAEGEKQLAAGEKEIAARTAELEAGKKELADGKALLSEKQAEYADGVAQLETARQALADAENGNWVTLVRKQNLSYVELKGMAETFVSISASFALLFVLLGGLVCYATIGKIVDEQTKLIGTTKALGFKRGEILAKYLLFGGGGAVLGAAVGIGIAYFILQPIMTFSMEKSYSLGEFDFVFLPVPALLSLLIAGALGVSASYLACGKQLKKAAVRLINGEVKGAANKEKHSKDGEKQKTLYAGLIIRNMREDSKRVAITVASIAGCCMLLLIGFSMKFSYITLIDRQFHTVLQYDSSVSFQADAEGAAEKEIADVIDAFADGKLPTWQFGTALRIGNTTETAAIFCADPEKMLDYCGLYDLGKGEYTRLPDGGVFIFSRLAEVYHLGAGDHLSILDPSGVYRDVTVAGVYDNYVGRNIYMSADYAKRIFSDAYRINAFAVKHSPDVSDALQAELKAKDSFISFTGMEELKGKVNEGSQIMNILIITMIVMAGIMAAVVLLNLVKIQVNQKKRELTVMRINGFTVRETVNYILKENVITTLIGIVLGIAAGVGAARYNLGTIERVDLQMARQINLPSCLLAALITLLFAAVVNYAALRKIRTLKLTRLD